MSDLLSVLTGPTMRPAALVTVTIGGRTFQCTRRTAAHLLWTIAELEQLHPGARLVVIQGCYNTGVAASAFTHDYDAVLDVQIVGLEWWDAQSFLRACGWAAWFRHTGSWAAASQWHIHMISLGFPGKVGKFIDGGLSLFGRVIGSSQVADYFRHALGLAGQHDSGGDSSWFPPDIDSTIFDYPAWVRDQEDTMTPQQMDQLVEKLRPVIRAEVAAELDTTVDTKAGKRSLRQMAKETFQLVRGSKP